MAVSLGDIVVRFLADTTELVAGVEESKGMLGNFGGIAAGVGIAAGAAMVGIGVESVKMAGEFQQSLTQLVTGAGESQKNLGMVGEGIKSISVESGTSTKALTEGMYMIESAGFHGAAGLDVLKASAEGARAGNANLATAANAVTTLMTDYSNKHYTATQAMNALISTEQVGKTHLEDLGRSMGAVLPLASSLGISFPQVAGAMAVMTNSGMTARLSATNLANAIRSLAAPNAVAVGSMQAVGLSAQQLKDTLSTQGLSGAIKLIEEHVGKTFPAGSVEAVQAFKNIMGGATGYGVAIKLGGDHMKAYEANVKSIGVALSKNASDVEGFSNVQKNFSFQLDKAKMAGNALMITIGQALLPALTRLLENVTPMITKFNDWETKTHGIENALSTAGGVIKTVAEDIGKFVGWISGGTLPAQTFRDVLTGIGVAMAIIKAIEIAQAIGSFIEILPMVVGLTSMWAAGMAAVAIETLIAAAPFLAIAAVVAIVILAIQHWGEISKWLQGVWSAVAGFFVGLWDGIKINAIKIWFDIQSFFLKTWQDIQNIFKNAVQAVVGWFVWLYNHNYYFKALADFIYNTVNALGRWLSDTWKSITSWITVQWDRLSFSATAYWGLIVARIRQIVTQVASWLAAKWAEISKPVVDAWNKISGIIGGAWNTYIAGPIGRLWAQFSGWFGNLSNLAVQWGASLLANFGKGILSALGGLGNTVSQVAGTVGKFLGFHSPTELGPGRDADKWAPNLVKMYAGGLAAGVPQIASASSALIAPVGPRLSTPASGGASRSQTAHIHVYLGGKEIVSQLMPMVYDEARAMTGWRPVA